MIITIVGLGVIGGSYAKALQGKGHIIYGIDSNQSSINQAKALGVIEDGGVSDKHFIGQSDLVIICLYPELTIEFIKKHKFKKGSIITDVSGIKEFIMKEILTFLDEEVEFISGHPMAGREKRGFAYSSAEVFKGANYLLVPHKGNNKATILLMEDLIYSMGFKNVRYLSAEEHDVVIAFTSQLPHAIAVALINSSYEKYDIGSYIGDSYRDLTRIANINEELWSELFLKNKGNLIEWIGNFENQLALIKASLLEDNDEQLKRIFISSSKRREKLED
jgi:Prephenate dehydrogenase